MSGGRTALIFGATGLVGSRLLTKLLESDVYDKVRSVQRRERSEEQTSPKLEVVVDPMDPDLSHLADDIFKVDDVYCCLGTTIKKAGSSNDFRRIDGTLVKQVGERARTGGAKRIGLVSAIGASSASRFLYVRTKGEAEDYYMDLDGLEAVHIVQPSLLLGARNESRPIEYALQFLAPVYGPVLSWVSPANAPVSANDVAGALFELLVNHPEIKGKHRWTLPLKIASS